MMRRHSLPRQGSAAGVAGLRAGWADAARRRLDTRSGWGDVRQCYSAADSCWAVRPADHA